MAEVEKGVGGRLIVFFFWGVTKKSYKKGKANLEGERLASFFSETCFRDRDVLIGALKDKNCQCLQKIVWDLPETKLFAIKH